MVLKPKPLYFKYWFHNQLHIHKSHCSHNGRLSTTSSHARRMREHTFSMANHVQCAIQRDSGRTTLQLVGKCLCQRRRNTLINLLCCNSDVSQLRVNYYWLKLKIMKGSFSKPFINTKDTALPFYNFKEMSAPTINTTINICHRPKHCHPCMYTCWRHQLIYSIRAHNVFSARKPTVATSSSRSKHSSSTNN